MTKKIDIASLPVRAGSRYPAPYNEPCMARNATVLSDVAGITQYGVVKVRVPPGAWSSQRHAHSAEDEFVYGLEGEAVSITDDGEELFRAGDCIGFKAGTGDGHHFINRGDKDFVFLVVGGRSDEDWADYPDIDMKTLPGRYSGKGGYVRKNGEPI
jgi:uncharacterized cupin superfamily protein